MPWGDDRSFVKVQTWVTWNLENSDLNEARIQTFKT
jgi:hypothetical protein